MPPGQVTLAGYEVVLFDFFGTLVEYQPSRIEHAYPATHQLLTARSHDVSYADFLAEWDAASTALEQRSATTLEEFSMQDAAAAFATARGLTLTEQERQDLASTFVSEWADHVRQTERLLDRPPGGFGVLRPQTGDDAGRMLLP